MNNVKTKQNKPVKKGNRINENPVFHVTNIVVLSLTALVCILPFFNVLSTAISGHGIEVNFLPKNVTLESVIHVLSDVGLWRALGVSLMVTVVGTLISVLTMYSAAYALSKPDFPFRRLIMIFFIVTMVFSAGMVPNYFLVKTLGLTGTPFALILPPVVQAYNLILIKSYLEGLPKELEESAKMDGANSLQTMFQVMIPVSLPCVASVSLFTAVSYWNNYTNALLYLGTDEKWYPLSMYILNKIQADLSPVDQSFEYLREANIESAMVIFSILPILAIYPFVLKFFTKGVTVGSVKG